MGGILDSKRLQMQPGSFCIASDSNAEKPANTTVSPVRRLPDSGERAEARNPFERTMQQRRAKLE